MSMMTRSFADLIPARRLRMTARSFAALRMTIGAVALTACTQAVKLTPDDSKVVLANQAINAPNPGLPGTFAVKTMYYGNGTDKLRKEYKDSVTLKTPTVDGSAFVSLTGDAAKQHDKD